MVTKIEMKLSAFGVESDDFPSVNAYIDFEKDSSNCKKSFYNPAFEPSTYSLSKKELQCISKLLKHINLEKLKANYRYNATDMPSSQTTIFTTKGKFIINDYGLIGDYPLQELYKIVYKINFTNL